MISKEILFISNGSIVLYPIIYYNTIFHVFEKINKNLQTNQKLLLLVFFLILILEWYNIDHFF